MLLFCDSFDDRPISAIGDRYASSQFNISAGSAIGTGRTGNGLVLSTGELDQFDQITWQSNSTHQNLYVGVARIFNLSTALVSIRYNDIPQLYVQLNSDGTISVIRYDGGANTVLATSSQTVPASDFFYVEFYSKTDPSVGAYEVRIDGTRWLSATGVNTSSTGDAFANQVRLTYNHTGVDEHITTVDDFYISDDDADGGNALIVGFAGPVKIKCLEETGNGAVNQWTPLSGANYQNVDETTGEDGDTSYVATLTNEAVDVYSIDAFSVNNATIKAVAVHQWCKKLDGTERLVAPLAYVSSTEYAGDETALTGSYSRVFHAFERNPATGAAWTNAQLVAAQFGAKLATP